MTKEQKKADRVHAVLAKLQRSAPERRVRRLTCLCVALTTLNIAFLVLAAAGKGPAPPAATPAALRARSFVVMDEAGVSRALFGMMNNEPVLMMCDQQGLARLAMGVSEGQPVIQLGDKNSAQRLLIGMIDKEPAIQLRDHRDRPVAFLSISPTAGPVMALCTPGKKQKDDLESLLAGRGLTLCAGKAQEGPSISLYDENEQHRVNISMLENKIGFGIIGPDKKPRVSIGVFEDSGVLFLFDKNGKLTLAAP